MSRPGAAAAWWTVVALSAVVGCAGDDDASTAVVDDGGSTVIVTTTSTTTTGTTTGTGTIGTGTTGTGTTATGDPASDPPVTAPARIPMGDPQVGFEEVAALDRPVDAAWRPGDPAVHVVEQAGRIVAVDPASGSARTVLDITSLTSADRERGLLGLEFSADGGAAYVNYTDASGDTVITEYPVGADGTFDGSAPRVLLEIAQPYANHNGGDLAIGPDGLLYVGMGDGGSANDPERRALRLDTLLGKLLRIDPTPSADLPYTVPPDNPFVGVAGAAPEIFAIGLRNPWKFTFDPMTGDLWIADVGQNALEEVNFVPAGGTGIAGSGLSFGWSAFEGTDRLNGDVDPEGHTAPALTYRHGDDGCSVSGGAPYHGTGIPELVGGYVYSDYCSGRVWAFDVMAGRNVLLAELGAGITSVVAAPDGELWVTDSNGPLRRIVAVS
jgi:glucose/arabinose dehydrogenase